MGYFKSGKTEKKAEKTCFQNTTKYEKSAGYTF